MYKKYRGSVLFCTHTYGGRLHIETLMLAPGKLSRKRLQEILWAMVRRFIKVC